MSAAATWQLQHGCGTLRSCDGSAVVHVDRVATGMTDLRRGAQTWRGVHLLGVHVPGFPDPLPSTWIVDQYVRRNDLIVTFEHPEPDHMRTQVYWRYVWEEALAPGADAVRVDGVHLIVSLQTNRLDMRPTIEVVSDLPTQETLCLRDEHHDDWTTVIAEGQAKEPPAAAAWLVRLPDVDRSLVLMTLPSDLVAMRLQPQPTGWRYAFQLLDEHLEKGVIRRAQVAAWFVPRTADEVWGRQLFRQLLLAPPPLTT